MSCHKIRVFANSDIVNNLFNYVQIMLTVKLILPWQERARGDDLALVCDIVTSEPIKVGISSSGDAKMY